MDFNVWAAKFGSNENLFYFVKVSYVLVFRGFSWQNLSNIRVSVDCSVSIKKLIEKVRKMSILALK